ncbi:unnamed protein product [Brachionus calyciflorus]|uniref:Uncharacterized protein n=1 Tax=Brachionus calyciflorus TaxID=104777 RepID=A0A813Z4Z3_9BILA|nr:unnamed protein product [Brachionus calyciflorus]
MRYIQEFNRPGVTYDPPILVQLACEKDRNELLIQAKILRTLPGHQNIFINPDLTQTQRMVDKELRVLRNSKNEEESNQNSPFRWRIRGFELVRFKKQEEHFERGTRSSYNQRYNNNAEPRRGVSQPRGRGRY